MGGAGIGAYTLNNNTSGSYNTANGTFCLDTNTTGNFNTAVGYASLSDNIVGNYNTALGAGAISNDHDGCILLGVDATATADNQFVVGSASTNAGTVYSGTIVPNYYWEVKINGVNYYIPLKTV